MHLPYDIQSTEVMYYMVSLQYTGIPCTIYRTYCMARLQDRTTIIPPYKLYIVKNYSMMYDIKVILFYTIGKTIVL